MRIAVLLIVIGITTAAILHHALTWSKPKIAEMIERGEYGAYVKYLNVLRFSSNFTQKLVLDCCHEYAANITIGTPTQQFTVIPDTGSGTLWIPGTNCTFVHTNRTWNIIYTSGSAKGVYGIDIMRFGGVNEQPLTVPNTTFGIAKEISSYFEKIRIDGVLGLAFCNSETPPLMNAINQSLLDRPLFTIWLQQRKDFVKALGGLITYGAIDTTNCGEVIAFESLIPSTYYQFKISAIEIGNYTYEKEEDAISDSGSSYIEGPEVFIDWMAEAAGAVYNATDDLYYLECNVTIPILFITIGGNKYPVDPLNYILFANGNICALALAPFFGTAFEVPWTIGIPFIRQYCHIYNIEEMKIGFAPSLIK